MAEVEIKTLELSPTTRSSRSLEALVAAELELEPQSRTAEEMGVGSATYTKMLSRRWG